MSPDLTEARRLNSGAPRALAARWLGWMYAVLLVVGAAYAFSRYNVYMDAYEKAILVVSAAVLIGLGWYWRPIQALAALTAAVSLYSISLYAGKLAGADEVPLLKYLISSQSAILWMCTLFLLATASYWVGLFAFLGVNMFLSGLHSYGTL